MDEIILKFIQSLHGLSPEIVSLLLTMFCGLCIILCYRFFSKTGLMVLSSLLMVFANIQVLRTCDFSITNHPVALGTIFFAATYVITDILTEIYGKHVARKNIQLSVFSYIAISLLMIVDLGHAPNVDSKDAYTATVALFAPAFRIIIASSVAYFVSQLFDMHIFDRMKHSSRRHKLWVRVLTSTYISSFIDNALFSVLAWKLLAPHPVAWAALCKTYVLYAFFYRCIISTLLIPVIYWCKNFRN
jgi:uncharacterized integral membrane protein (TIGR00697 family)